VCNRQLLGRCKANACGIEDFDRALGFPSVCATPNDSHEPAPQRKARGSSCPNEAKPESGQGVTHLRIGIGCTVDVPMPLARDGLDAASAFACQRRGKQVVN
jgi:hypothetical protein